MSAQLFAYLLAISQTTAIDNSVILRVEQAEHMTSLDPKKYTQNQYQEILKALEQKEERLRVATYNLLRNDREENLDEANRWVHRLPRIVEAVHDMAPDAMGVQEPSPEQIEDLLGYLSDAYGFYGESMGGECNGIFYRKDRLEPVGRQVWKVPSADHSLSMLQFKDLQTGKKFALFNIHLAFCSPDQRELEARFIIEKMEAVAKTMPVLLMGDLNTFPNRIDLDRLPFLDGDYIHRILTEEILRDASDVSLLGHVGPISTFTNNPPSIKAFQGTGTPGVVLDHIYVSKEITVLIHAAQPVTVDSGYPSDHMPVFIDFTLN